MQAATNRNGGAAAAAAATRRRRVNVSKLEPHCPKQKTYGTRCWEARERWEREKVEGKGQPEVTARI